MINITRWLDAFRRRRETTQLKQWPHCDICHTQEDVSVLKNGGSICLICRSALEEM